MTLADDNPISTTVGESSRLGSFAVLHVPHSARSVPPDVCASLLLSDAELERELLLMTDAYTDEIFHLGGDVAESVRFPWSRLVVDPERFVDDEQEPMTARGMGVVYTRTSHGAVLRDSPTPAERSALVKRFYEPHHDRLAAAVDAALQHHGSCLVVDCHSFASHPLPCDLDQDPDRPEVCLGTDPSHTPGWLVDLAGDRFRLADLDVAVDRPFSGALVPGRFYRTDTRVLALMVELNRGLYMDEASGARLAHFGAVAGKVQRVLRDIVESARLRVSRSQ